MPHSLTVFLISSGVAAAIYLGTWAALGARADKQFGVAIALVFILTPWWAVLAGAIGGHVLCVIAVRKFGKREVPKNMSLAVLLAMGFFCAMSMYSVNSVWTQVQSLVLDANNRAWLEYAAAGEPNHFVAEHYRACVEEKSYGFLSISTKTAPGVCRSSTVALAALTKGSEFGRAVDASIAGWLALPFEEKSAQKISKLLASI